MGKYVGRYGVKFFFTLFFILWRRDSLGLASVEENGKRSAGYVFIRKILRKPRAHLVNVLTTPIACILLSPNVRIPLIMTYSYHSKIAKV